MLIYHQEDIAASTWDQPHRNHSRYESVHYSGVIMSAMASQTTGVCCLLNCFFRRRSEKTSKLQVIGFCAGNSPVTGQFPTQRASNAENASIWWCRHVKCVWKIQNQIMATSVMEQRVICISMSFMVGIALLRYWELCDNSAVGLHPIWKLHISKWVVIACCLISTIEIPILMYRMWHCYIAPGGCV